MKALIALAVLAGAVAAGPADTSPATPAKPATPPAPAAAAPGPVAATKPPAESCATCHAETGDDRLAQPVKLFASDIHAAKGFGCTACHGGDPREPGMESMDPAKGYIGKPGRRQTIQVCGRCHASARFMRQYNPSLRVDQVAEYETSVHGRRLREKNDPKVAICTSCHPAHAIKPPSDASSSVHPLRVADTCGTCHADAKYMAGYGIPTDQLAKYRESVHWKMMSVKGDLSAPTCNDCHGNHGAAPPGVSWVGNVCGQCHTVIAETFGKSVKARIFRDLGNPGCATCHQNHAIKEARAELLGTGEGAVCAGCHSGDDKGTRTASEMRGLLDQLRGDSDRARGLLREAEHAGMEVSQAQFELNGAGDALVKARAAVHTFTVDAVKQNVTAGLAITAKAYARGERAMKDLKFRRQGLAVSVVIILVLIGGLVIKIRQVDRQVPLRPFNPSGGAGHE